MKTKAFIVMLAMAFCASGMRAQNVVNDNDDVNVEATTEEAAASSNEDGNGGNKPSRTFSKNSDTIPAPKADNYEALAEAVKIFNKMALENQQKTTDDYKNILVPVEGRSKFMRRHHVTQRLEVSILGGSDSNDDSADEFAQDMKQGEDEEDKPNEGKMNFGFNVGYSLVFIPGHVEGDQLRLNKFGFGYSLGILASFDKQDHYGVTCDFMAKIGVETGNNHAMGIGFDALIGTGKSCGEFYHYDTHTDPEGAQQKEEAGQNPYDDWSEPYTAWCLKYGAQVWVRSNLLKTSIGNTDVRLFARYIYSKNPHKTNELEGYELFGDWLEESWQFGLTFCYTF